MKRLLRLCVAVIAIVTAYPVRGGECYPGVFCWVSIVTEITLDADFPSSFSFMGEPGAANYPCTKIGDKSFHFTGTSFENTKGAYTMVLAALLSQKYIMVYYTPSPDGTCQAYRVNVYR